MTKGTLMGGYRKRNRLLKEIKSKWFLIVAVLLYILLAAYFFPFYRYQISPDCVSYFSIAQKYLHGDFSLAINGYWSPFFSWLMVPLLFVGLEPLIAARIIILTAGALTVWGVGLLTSKLRIERNVRFVILISSVPLVLHFAYYFIGTDLLTVCTLIYYLIFVLDKKYSKNIKIALWAGFFGALAYLSKTYNFAFFLIHFSLINMIMFFFKGPHAAKRKRILYSYLFGILLFFLISGVWIFLISQKYDRFTIGTSGKYNYSIIGPESKGHSTHYRGFLPPPDEKAVSAWDDPSYFIVDDWSPLSSIDNFKHQIRVIKKNIKAIPLLFFIYVFSASFSSLFIFKSFKRGYFRDMKEFFILSALVIYPIGYFLVTVGHRHVWLLPILATIVVGYILTNVFRWKLISKHLKRIMLVLLFSSILISPIIFFNDPRLRYKERGIYNLSHALRKYNLEGKVASSQESWPFALYLAYYLELKYYGEASPEAETHEDFLQNELLKFNIDYFIVLKEENYNFLKAYEEVTKKDHFAFKVYDLKRPIGKNGQGRGKLNL